MNWIRNCIALSVLCIPSLAAAANTGQTMEYGTSAGWNSNYNLWVNNVERTYDWDIYQFKGECPRTDFNSPRGLPYNGQRFTNGAIAGLSGDYYRRMMIHGLGCAGGGVFGFFDPQSFQTGLAGMLTFDGHGGTSSGPLPITSQHPQGWDWDPGYQKTTCFANKYIAGVAQKYDGSGLDAVQCAQISQVFTRNDNGCYVITMGVDYSGFNHGSDGSSEWDFGYQKGLCNNSAIAGISRNVPEWDSNYGGGLHAILCCPARDLAGS